MAIYAIVFYNHVIHDDVIDAHIVACERHGYVSGCRAVGHSGECGANGD
jgi:hypothetical protein